MPYFTWDHNGKCSHVEYVEIPCPGPKGQHKTWHNEYGDAQLCDGGCRGTGTLSVPRYTHVPEFDAPQPPADFVLREHVVAIIDNIYFGGTSS